MTLGLSWFRLVPLVALLWGLPAEATAKISRQASFSQVSFKEGLEKLEADKPEPLLIPIKQRVRQTTAVKQNDTEQDVLFEIEGTLAEGDTRLDDGSLRDIHVFEGQAEQIVRITLTSDEFDTFLVLYSASGEELARNDDGSDGTNSEIVFRLPTAERYPIVVNAYDESGRGAYRLTVKRSDEDTLHQVEQKIEADRLFQQGNDAFLLSQYQAALESWQAALERYDEIGNQQGKANTLGSLGSAYRSLGEYQQAVDFYQQSLEIFLDLGDRQGEAASLGNLGTAYYNIGEYQQAIEFLEQPLAFAREIGDRQDEAIALGNLGSAYYTIGEYQRAIDLQQQSLTITRDIRDRLGESNALGNLGNIYDSLGEYQRAIDLHQQSLAIAREIGDRLGESNSLSGLGLSYDSLGKYQQAIDLHQQSLVVSREIGYRLGEAASLGNLGLAYDNLGEYQKALSFHQQYLAISREIGDRQGEATALANSGIVYRKQGNLQQAEASLSEAIYILENLRGTGLTDQSRVSFFETQVSAYKNLEQALVLQNKFETALEIAERGRTRSFVQLLLERSSLDPESQDPTASHSFSEIQRIAGEQQSTLVEYSIANSSFGNGVSLYIWLVQPTGKLYFKEVPIGDSLADIADLVAQSRTAMGVPGRGGLAPATASINNATEEFKELHQLLIEPIAEWLPEDPEERVVFIPQGDLFLVPFPALQDASGTHLIEQHTILTAPSIQVLDLTQQQATAANGSAPATEHLIVGNPVMPEVWNPEKDVLTQLSPLIGAEAEAQAIANFFDTEALLGAQATEPAVKQQIENARIVHLATHGLLEYGTPEESGVRDVPGAIALAPTATEDGLLTASEIIEELTLQAELVVLSACDTGLGTITGDGVIGLSRSLIAAGTPSVIVSLWAIPDAPTAELMTEFYRQRQQGQDKAQALRQAMLMTMETHPNPRNWAAFTLIGEAD